MMGLVSFFHRVAGTSGGKDSTALYSWLMEKGKAFDAVYADTGLESPVTTEYVNEMAAKIGGPPVRTIRADLSGDVERKRRNLPEKWSKQGIPDKHIQEALELLVPTGNPFLDLCLSRGGFPSMRRRFCTQELKVRPFSEQVYAPLLEAGKIPLSFQGIRREESKARAAMPVRQKMFAFDCDYLIVRPLLDWTIDDVMEQLARHGIKPNPLYKRGFNRVGCWPCVNASKDDIRSWSQFDPAAIEQIERMEELVNKVSPFGNATYFPGRDVSPVRPIHYTTHGIREQVKWSMTARGGKQHDFVRAMEQHESESGEAWDSHCAIHGVCE